MKFLRAALEIGCNDLRRMLRDPVGLALGFLLPLILVAVFGFVYQMTMGGEDGLGRTTLWVADRDRGADSARLVEELRAAPLLRVRPAEDEEAVTAEELRRRVADGEIHHALVLEEGFGREIAAGRLPRLTLYRDPGRTLESRLVSIGVMQSFFAVGGDELSSLLTVRGLELAGLPPEMRERALATSRAFTRSVTALFAEAGPGGGDAPRGGRMDAAAVFEDLVPLERVDFAPPERPKKLSYILAHNVAGMSVMMLMFGLVACSTLLIAERESGTLKRLLLAAVPRDSILFGKMISTLVMGVLQLAVMLAFGALLFDVELLRAPLAMAVIAAVLVLSIASFGLLVAAFARTTKQAEGVSTLVILVMSAVGGAWFPLYMFELPAAGVIATRSTLTYWAMTAFKAYLWDGKGLGDAALHVPLLVLLGFTAVALIVARWAFRRNYVPR